MDRKNNDNDTTSGLYSQQNTKRNENAANNEMEKHGRMKDAICMNDICITTLQIWSSELYRIERRQRKKQYKIQKIPE